MSALARALTAQQGWALAGVRFYTGIPDAADNARWHHFWTAKRAAMGRQGVVVFSRPLRYRNRTVRLSDGTSHVVLSGEEKGIDVRIALDVIAGAHRGANDVAVILSQDQDLSEVATALTGFPSTAPCMTGASIAATTGRAAVQSVEPDDTRSAGSGTVVRAQ